MTFSCVLRSPTVRRGIADRLDAVERGGFAPIHWCRTASACSVSCLSPLTDGSRTQVDMVAWVEYCHAPRKQAWMRILSNTDAPTTPTSLRYDTSNQRIAHHRGFHLQARREFQVGARHQDSSLSDQYDKLLNAYPRVY